MFDFEVQYLFGIFINELKYIILFYKFNRYFGRVAKILLPQTHTKLTKNPYHVTNNLVVQIFYWFQYLLVLTKVKLNFDLIRLYIFWIYISAVEKIIYLINFRKSVELSSNTQLISNPKNCFSLLFVLTCSSCWDPVVCSVTVSL